MPDSDVAGLFAGTFHWQCGCRGRIKLNPDRFPLRLKQIQVQKEAVNSVASLLIIEGASLIENPLSELPLIELLDKVK